MFVPQTVDSKQAFLTHTSSTCRRKELGLPEQIVLKPETAEDIAAAHAAYVKHHKSRSCLPTRKSIMSQDIFSSKGVKKSSSKQVTSQKSKRIMRHVKT